MAKEWCIEGMEIELSANQSPVTFPPGAGPTFTTQPSQKTKIKNSQGQLKGVYFGPVTFTFTGTSWNGYTQTSPGSITFNLQDEDAKAKYSKEQGKPILIHEDEADTLVPVPYVLGQTTQTLTVHAKIKTPGQTYVKEK